MQTLKLGNNCSKSQIYKELLPQIKSLLEGEPDRVARMANFSAALKEAMNFHWVGFYRVVGEELVLGPFQGPMACTRIAKGRGVCGAAWAQGQALWVPDVHEFSDHIACSALSRSEIVIPLRDEENNIWGVLDVDHVDVGGLNEEDLKYLSELAQLI
jgi:GAF domain-containing protein